MFELRFFEVCGNPDVIQGNDREEALSRLNAMAELNCFSSDDAADWGIEFCVAEIELSGMQIGASLLQMSAGRFRLSASVGNLLRSNAGGFDLRFPLDDKAARLGDVLLPGGNRRAIGFHRLCG